MERLGDSVERTLARSGGETTLALSRITAIWPDAVGQAVARQAWPLRLARDGTLHVATASATWAFELDRLSPQVKERLTALLGAGAPQSLRFRVGPIPESGHVPEPAPAPSRSAAGASPEAAAEADSAAAEIEDPELRELARRAALASLEKARSGRTF